MKPGVVWVLLTVCIPQFAAEPFTTKLGFDLMQITRRRDHCEAAIPECYELDQEELSSKSSGTESPAVLLLMSSRPPAM